MTDVEKKQLELGNEEWNRRWMAFSNRLIRRTQEEMKDIVEKYKASQEVAQ